MLKKKSTTVKQTLLAGAIFATLFAIGCNNAEKTESTEMPATTTPPMDTTMVSPSDSALKGMDTVKKVMDTASIRPTKTPTRR